MRSILSAQDRSCRRQAVQLNAGAALYIAGKAGSYREGVRLAGEIIDSGAAERKLQQFIRLTNRTA